MGNILSPGKERTYPFVRKSCMTYVESAGDTANWGGATKIA